MFTNLNLTDMETGYKVFKIKCFKNLTLVENSFGFEAEITAKLAKKNIPFMKLAYLILEEIILRVKKLV